MFKLVGMVCGVAVGWLFGVALATALQAFDVSPQKIEVVALTVTFPALVLFGAWGGLIGYRRDHRKT